MKKKIQLIIIMVMFTCSALFIGEKLGFQIPGSATAKDMPDSKTKTKSKTEKDMPDSKTKKDALDYRASITGPSCKLIFGMTRGQGQLEFEQTITKRYKLGYRVVGFNSSSHEKGGYSVQALMCKE